MWLHVAFIPLFAVIVGYPLLHGLVDDAPVALLALSAGLKHGSGRRARGVLATMGLLSASAVLVHLASGATIMHFHFFVTIALVAVYQDWLPFGMALLFVVVHHALLGVLMPHIVYDDSPAVHDPLLWAVFHAVFVLGASGAQLMSWRMSERQHEASEAELRAREQRFRALIEHASDAVTVIGRDGVVLYDSPSVESIYGLPPSERLGRSDISSMHPDDMPAVMTAMRGLGEGESITFQCRFFDGRGGLRWVECRATNLLHVPGLHGHVVNYRDITDRFHDTLTDLPNRSLFAQRVERADRPAVLFVGLDEFKGVNDGLGHKSGDAVLREVARRLVAVVDGAEDVIGRVGGDEFAVLLPATSPEDAFEMANRVAASIAEPIRLGDVNVAVTCSIGLTCEGNEVLHDAELAMHKAKRLGRGRIELFEDGLREAVVDRLALKVDLRRAVAAGELVAYYQPIVSLQTGRIVSAEALVRWEHPVRGVLGPGGFIALAEESGLIIDIGRQVLRQACASAMTWPAPIGVSVNLSARQLQDDCVVALVRDVLRQTGLPASRLTLEITESMLVADPVESARVLDGLKSLGVSVSLDDFGTGYSSLSYLSNFPVDGIKIDKTFVDAVDTGTDNERALLQAIVGLGRTLELSVVAEGIERVPQWAELQALGCGLGQGYLFARPMPDVNFRALASTSLAVV